MTKQGEVEALLGVELLDRVDRVGRDAEHDRAGLLVGGQVVANAAGLGRAPGRVGLGVEVEDHGAAAQVGERDRLAVLVGEREVGGGAASFDHAFEGTSHRPGVITSGPRRH
jgi:hypothetical protein